MNTTLKRFIVPFVLISLVLVSVGCTTREGEGGEENFRVGTRGLEMRFGVNSPPPRLYDDEDFRVIIELYNEGATDISGGNNRIYLSGFDSSIITGISTYGATIQDLEGKSMYNPQGDYDVVEINGYVRDLKSRNIDTLDQDLLVTACYNYETIAAPVVCIDPDPYSVTKEEKVCDANYVVDFVGTQAAPVAVTNVQVEPAPKRTQFKIYVKNVGVGTVIKPGFGYLDRCNPYDPVGLDYNDVDYVRVDEVKVGDMSIKGSCKPLENDMLRLQSYSQSPKGASSAAIGYMICELDGITGPAYTTPLRIKLSYGYRDSIVERVKLIQTP